MNKYSKYKKTSNYLVKVFIISQELEKYHQNRLIISAKFNREID